MISTAVLSAQKDPMGLAIYDFYTKKSSSTLRVFSSMFEEDEIPVKHLFREEKKLPVLEKTALKLANGKILDVGAGSGCHSLILQNRGCEVHAIDISPWSVSVMKSRGITNCYQVNLFDSSFNMQFDTILMLMNGSGVIGKINNLQHFFKRIDQLLLPDGFVLMDSSDLIYLLENEDGSVDIDLSGEYYGEVDYQMQYEDVVGDSFDWLYIDFDNLQYYANKNGFNAELVKKGSHYDYLAKLSRL